MENVSGNDTNGDKFGGISTENNADEFTVPGSDDNSDNGLSNEASGVSIARSGRIIRPYDCAKHFPETAHFQQDNTSSDGACLKPHGADEDNLTMKLGKGMLCSNCYFGEEAKTT